MAVDDFGKVINPMIVEGQVHGGLAQGIGQALTENCVYDDSGQLLSASYMDYCMPKADNVPSFQVAHDRDALHPQHARRQGLRRGRRDRRAAGGDERHHRRDRGAHLDAGDGGEGVAGPAKPADAPGGGIGRHKQCTHSSIIVRSTVAEAVSLLQGASDGKLLAGGHTLIPTLKQRLASPSALIDLGGIKDLKGILVDRGSQLRIGAMTPHAEVAASADVRGWIPALAVLAEHIGDAQVRNRGTIGGSIANNDPAADYPAAIVGLNATVHTNKRTIAADDFFTGMFDTALNDGEIITEVRFPKPDKAGYAKFPNPASRYAIVGVMVAQTGGGVRVAVTGAGPCVFRLPDFEQALASNFSPSAVDGLKVSSSNLNSDIHASAEYRAHLVKVMAKRAIAAAS